MKKRGEEKKKRKKKRKRKGMDFSMEVRKKKSNHKPIFDEFGSKRTPLGILVVFWTWVG